MSVATTSLASGSFASESAEFWDPTNEHRYSSKATTAAVVILAMQVLIPSGLPVPLRVLTVCVSLILLFQIVTVAPAANRSLLPILIGTFLAIQISSLARGTIPGERIFGLVTFAIPVFVISILVTRIRQEHYDILRNSFIFIAAFQSAIAVSQFTLGWPLIWEWAGYDPGTILAGVNLLIPGARAHGSMGHAIPLSLICVLGIVYLLRDRTFKPYLRIAFLALLIVGIGVSGSRSPIFVLILVLLCGIALGAFPFAKIPVRFIAGFAATLTFLFVDIQSLTIVNSLGTSASLANRLEAIPSFGRLFSRPLNEIMIGSGWMAEDSLRNASLIQERFAIDNGFVAAFAITGLFGLSVAVAMLVKGLRLPDRGDKIAVLAFFAFLFSFDALQWQVPFSMLVIVLSFRTPDITPATLATQRKEPSWECHWTHTQNHDDSRQHGSPWIPSLYPVYAARDFGSPERVPVTK